MKSSSDHKGQVILAVSTVHNAPQTFVLQPLSGRASYAFCCFCFPSSSAYYWPSYISVGWHAFGNNCT